MTATAPEPAGEVLDGYRSRLGPREVVPGVAGVDELVTSEGIRSEQQLLATAAAGMGLAGLLAARAEAARLVEDDGIRYGASASGGQGRNWVIDPLPVVLTAAEWTRLERGLVQRARLLDMVLADLYGPRSLLRRGVIPPEVVLGHPGFVRQGDGIRLPGPRQLVVSATDLGRDADGGWQALSDRTAVPSGAGYAMANRRIVSRVMAGLHRTTPLTRMRGFFHTMTAALQEVAPAGSAAPQVVLLSPGSGSETAYEQGFMATLLGFPLVEAEDLTIRDGRVWVRGTDRGDHAAPVDVLLRRVDAPYADPLELRPDSRLGLPGLLEAARRGSVAVVNPVGAEVLENPGLLPFLPEAARALLDEDLVLPSATTWWCGDPVARQHVLSQLERLIVKPIARGLVAAPHFGWLLSAERRADLRRQIAQTPWAWCGQDPLPMSTAPVVTRTGLEPRRLVLRTFAVARGDAHHMLPGGLGRVAPDGGSPLVSNISGALAKDVWVLASAEAPRAGWGGEQRPEPRPALAGLRHAALAPRVAENLFWAGRYAERAEGTARLLRVADDLVEDHANRLGTPGAAAMAALLEAVSRVTRVPPLGDPASPVATVRRLVADASVPGTVAYATERLVRAAQEVRDQLSYDIWHVLSRLERTLADLPPERSQLQPQLYNVLESLLAVSGIIGESMVRDASWGFLDGGTRVERAQLTTALLRSTLTRERPPIIDGQVTEAVLEAGESIITHRRRAAAGEGPAWPVHSAVTLLLADRGNPRSVAFQLHRLGEDLRLVGDEVLAEEADARAGRVAALDLESLCAGDRSLLEATLEELAQALRGLSDEITGRHFRRKATQRALVPDWALGAQGGPA